MPKIDMTDEECYILCKIFNKIKEAQPQHDKDEFVRNALALLHCGYNDLQKKDENNESFENLFDDLQSTCTAIVSILASYRAKCKRGDANAED